ncbi:hypothetical protein [Streptomyces seoulensis]|uniref:hypothetical protein n=1 Tax=Streptomyces seoulensis TaxID=73044 RepID=UPI001FCC9953|nr:hypothetical protein [Streptomyces seoulensis]
MLHGIEGVARELARISERPVIDPGTPVLTCVAVAPEGGAVEDCACRLRDVLSAVLSLALDADFDEEELPVDGIADWFLSACSDGGAVGPTVGVARARYRERTGAEPWGIQNWLFRFDPELEARGWEFWGLTRAADGGGRLDLWLDTWGEPMFSWEELRWLLYACGAQAVADPVVVGSGSWVAEATV